MQYGQRRAQLVRAGGGGDTLTQEDGSKLIQPAMGENVRMIGLIDPASIGVSGDPDFNTGNAGEIQLILGMDHTNTKMKQGLSLKAAVNNVQEVLTLKSAHASSVDGSGHASFGGTTDLDTFMYIKMQATSHDAANSGVGGPSLAGFQGPAGTLPVWLIRAYAANLFASTANNVAKSTNAQGVFDFRAIRDNGAGGTTTMAAGTNLATWRNNSTTKFAIAESSLFLAEAGTVPAANPTGGIELYVEGSTLKYRKPDGTVVTP